MMGAIQALKEFLHWRRVAAEISARRLMLDEMEKIEEEIDELEDGIDKYRASGLHGNADRLLLAQSRRAALERGILDLAEGADFHCSERRDFGGFGSGEGKRQGDN